jgi:hypothetical protein
MLSPESEGLAADTKFIKFKATWMAEQVRGCHICQFVKNHLQALLCHVANKITKKCNGYGMKVELIRR